MTVTADTHRPPDVLPSRLGRRELLTLISAIMALTAMAIDLMLPAFGDIRTAFELGEGSNETGRIVTYFFFGLAAGQLVYGPLADRFGRKPTLYLGIGIYMAGAVGSAVAPSFGFLLVSRVIWGLGAAGSRVVATAIIRDRFEGVAMAKAMSQIMAVFVLVPVAAPTLGAGIIAVFPWRSLFWFCVLFALSITLWSLRLMETLDPRDRRELRLGTTVRGYLEVARTPVTFGYTVATIFLMGVFTTYLASVDLVISEVFDRESQFPFIFGGVAILFGIAALVNGRVVERLGIDGVVDRSFAALGILVPILIAITVLGNGRPNFWLFIPTVGLVLSSFMFLIPNLNSAALEPVGHIAGSASALTGSVRIAGGAVVGTVISSQVDDSLTPLVIGIALMCVCAGVSVALVRRRNVSGFDLAAGTS
ncbi:MAG: multidrug effflux MFS transporter [Acidimicrobiia bacterium]|nr:multidrug effflux MFS transporter [Acidimicrobiia bacterium]